MLTRAVRRFGRSATVGVSAATRAHSLCRRGLSAQSLDAPVVGLEDTHCYNRPRRRVRVYRFDTSPGAPPVPYAAAQNWQRQWRAAGQAAVAAAGASNAHGHAHGHEHGHEDALFVLHHAPVYTLGRGASEQHIRFPFNAVRDPPNSKSALAVRYTVSPPASGTGTGTGTGSSGSSGSSSAERESESGGFDLQRVERGGEVTYHGPGQVVVYPCLDLRAYRRDLRWYVTRLEEAIIRALARTHPHLPPAVRVPGKVGVFVAADANANAKVNGTANATANGTANANGSGKLKKVAAIGIAVSRWLCTHGLAVNVSPRVLSGFERIVPCGLDDVEVGALDTASTSASASASAAEQRHSEQRVASELVAQFAAVFNADVGGADVTAHTHVSPQRDAATGRLVWPRDLPFWPPLPPPSPSTAAADD